MKSTVFKTFLQLIGLIVVSFFSLQLFFLIKIAFMHVVSPQSTSFQRSEAWRIVIKHRELPWRQSWVNYDSIATSIKQAVITSEDGDFINHDGVEWDAVESAWTKNSKALERAEIRFKKAQKSRPNASKVVKSVKIIGGSTISQQLAKNLFLSGERDFVRKGQEFFITQFLEYTLNKRLILEIYLNNVEWGEGVFGIEAAAQHYFRKPAKQLSSYESARLAVMLPRPKYFENLSGSSYLSSRAASIVARMADAEVP